jgi:hypothetical protein
MIPRTIKHPLLLSIVTLCCTSVAWAQNVNGTNIDNIDSRPQIAVYVAGGHDAGVNRALATRLLEAFVNSKQYSAIERSGDFLAEIDREQVMQRSGAVNDEQIRALGRQAGAHFVCIADITPALGSYQVSARIIDVETAAVVAIGVSDSRLQTIGDLTAASNTIVAMLLGTSRQNGRQTRQQRQTAPQPTEPEPITVAEPITKPEPITKVEPRPERESRSPRLDFYIAPRYVYPMTDFAPNWAVDVHGGVIWGSGWFLGLGFGLGESNSAPGMLDDGGLGFATDLRSTVGVGLNIGRMYDLPTQLQFSGGVFVGHWRERLEERERLWGTQNTDYYKNGSIGPFVSLRWRYVEFSYRMIMGNYRYTSYGFTGRGIGEDESNFGIINQLMLGFNFQTSRR